MAAAKALPKEKLDALIDGMGEYIGKCLSIKDPDIGPAQHWSDDRLPPVGSAPCTSRWPT